LRTFAVDGTTIASTSVNNSLTTGPATFAGSATIENVGNLVITELTGANAGIPQASTFKTYQNRNTTDVLNFGAVTSFSSVRAGVTTTQNLTISLAPPTRRPLNPVLNTTYSSSTSATTQITGLPNTTQALTLLYTPLAFENITVPAGTFPVCKYTNGASGALSTEYSIASGNCLGMVIRTLNASGVLSSEVTSVSVNGAACS
jgi:hypothetical protein